MSLRQTFRVLTMESGGFEMERSRTRFGELEENCYALLTWTLLLYLQQSVASSNGVY